MNVIGRCDQCGKTFAVKSTLDAHIRSHSGSKQFQCQVCHTFFASKGSYSIHMRIHTGDKPLQCPYCYMKFRTSGHRKSHILSHFKTSAEQQQQQSTVALASSDAALAVSDGGTAADEAAVVGIPDDANNEENHILANVEQVQNADGTLSFILQMPTTGGLQNINLSSIDASNILNLQSLQQLSTLFNTNSAGEMEAAEIALPEGTRNVDAIEDEEVVSVNPNAVFGRIVSDDQGHEVNLASASAEQYVTDICNIPDTQLARKPSRGKQTFTLAKVGDAGMNKLEDILESNEPSGSTSMLGGSFVLDDSLSSSQNNNRRSSKTSPKSSKVSPSKKARDTQLQQVEATVECLFCHQSYPSKNQLSFHVASSHLDLVLENQDLVDRMGLVLKWNDMDSSDNRSFVL